MKFFGMHLGGTPRVSVEKVTIDGFADLSGKIYPHGSAKEFLQQFRPVFDSKKKRQITIDLTKVKSIDLEGIALLFAVKETVLRDDCSVKVNVAKGSLVHEYLVTYGLDSYFDIPAFPEMATRQLDSNTNVFKAIYRSSIDNPSKIAAEIGDYLISKSALVREFEPNFTDSMDELLRNIDQHSGCSNFVLIVQVMPEHSAIKLVIYDNGVGIREHLTKVPYEARPAIFKKIIKKDLYEKMKESPRTAIKWALEECVSGTDYTRNGGAGLNFLKAEIGPRGAITVISENGYVSVTGGQEPNAVKLPAILRGTLIFITMHEE